MTERKIRRRIEKPEGPHIYHPVDLEDVLKNPGQFSQTVTRSGIETKGLYYVFERQLHTGTSRYYGYDGFGASYAYFKIFTIEESGILVCKSGHLRVHRKYGIGESKDKADEIMAEGSGSKGFVIVRGDVMQGFPGEYYLDVIGSDSKIEVKVKVTEEGIVFDEPKD